MFWIVVLLWTADPEILRVDTLGISVQGDSKSRFAPPIAMRQDREHIYILDSAFQLWFLGRDGSVKARVGGKGKTPGTFDPVFRNLVLADNKVVVYHDSGHRMETFDRSGAFVTTGRNRGLPTYADTKNHIELGGTHPRDTASVTITWRHNGNQEIIPLMAEDESDRCPWRYTLMTRGGDFALIHTTLSLKKIIYYAILNLSTGDIWDLGKLHMTDPRAYPPEWVEAARTREDFSLPTVIGSTYSDEMGFVLTENTVGGQFRMLRVLNPEPRTQRVIRLECGPMGDVAFAQHLEGRQWVGFRGSQLTFFTVSTP